MDEVTKKLLDEIDVLSEYDRDNYQVIKQHLELIWKEIYF